MGAQGQGVERRLHKSPMLATVAGHPLVVTARRDWPTDTQVHLLASELAVVAEAELRGAHRRVAIEPPETVARTLWQTVKAVRHAQRHFPGPETQAWAAEAERALLELAVSRWGVERILLQLAEAVVVARAPA